MIAFSRWVELYPTKSTTAVESASCIFQHFGRFGNPEVVDTDRGPAFHNEVIEGLLRMSGTDQSLTTAYSREENGIVERANQEVLRQVVLRATAYGTKDNEHVGEDSNRCNTGSTYFK